MLIKCLKFIYLNKSGRNLSGQVTVRGRGNRRYHANCHINRSYFLMGVRNVVLWVGFLNYCTSYVMLCRALNSVLFYSVATAGIRFGQELHTGIGSRNVLGYSLPLYSMLLTSNIHSVENKRSSGCIYSRAAGTFSRVVRKHSRTGYVTLRLPSKKINYVKWDCYGTVGIVSNETHFLRKLDKAGVSVGFGFKSKVRGVAMNPVDHPLGGGEGKSSGGRINCSPWGWKTKGPKTVSVVRKRFLTRLRLHIDKNFT